MLNIHVSLIVRLAGPSLAKNGSANLAFSIKTKHKFNQGNQCRNLITKKCFAINIYNNKKSGVSSIHNSLDS